NLQNHHRNGHNDHSFIQTSNPNPHKLPPHHHPQTPLPPNLPPNHHPQTQTPSLKTQIPNPSNNLPLPLLRLPTPSFAFEKAALFDFNLTLPIIVVEFLFLMVALDKLYFTPLGNFMDERDTSIRDKLNSVKGTSEEVK
ncbi:hypothetical protein KIW84_051058, partial [Lathyrus oleraceus]